MSVVGVKSLCPLLGSDTTNPVGFFVESVKPPLFEGPSPVRHVLKDATSKVPVEYWSYTCSDGRVMGSDVLHSHKVVTMLPRMVVANEARGRA